jgi:enediyne biosynthesis protein E4
VTGVPATPDPVPDAVPGVIATAPAARRRVPVVAAVVLLALLIVAAAAAVVRIAGGAAGTPPVALGAPHYVDETASSGLDYAYAGGTTFDTGGGLAVLDCDEDGLPDLYVAGGDGPAALFRNASAVGGALRFVRVADPSTDLAGVTGAYPLDVDGDGHADLAVLRVGQPVLLRGLGGCRFEPANDAWGLVAADAWTTAFSATWEGAATWPTVALGTYVTVDASHRPTWDCGPNALYRPAAGGGGFGAPVALAPGHCTLSMLFSAWDGSTRRDLRVTNDRHYYADGAEELWRMDAGADPRAYAADDGWASLQVWGMGIASRDLTGDGLPEVFLTSQGDNKLQTLLAGAASPAYRDIAAKRGVTATVPFAGGDPLPSTAWHPEFVDVNDDGLVDLFVSKGNVRADPGYASRDPGELLLGQVDGSFVQGAADAGLVTFDRGRGATLADLNLDGLPDLVEVFLDAPVRAWRNVGAGTAAAPGAMGGWLGIRLAQPGANRDAIGALVDVRVGERTQRIEVTVGGGHISGRLGPVLVGIGGSTRADIRVTWPDGEVGPWVSVDAGRYLEVRRGEAGPAPWVPPVLAGSR